MEWRSYNIRLGDGQYTMGDDRVGLGELMDARYLQLVSDLAHKPLCELRVLDLGAAEGLYGLELALQGATVLALEGREGPAERARHAAAALGLGDRYEVRVADVRELSVERYGTFDVVLCLGILYHLEAPDVFRLVRGTYELAEDLVIFRTAVGLQPKVDVREDGRTYHGFVYSETGTEWASLDNPRSFWPTRPSLLNLLCDVGFTSIVESVAPVVDGIDVLEDAIVLAAYKGRPVDAEAVAERASPEWRGTRIPERQRPERHPAQRALASAPLLRRLATRRFWASKTRRS